MTEQNTKLPQSIFPDLPRTIPFVDKDGNLHPLWSLAFSSLFQALQANFKNEGILFPSLDSTAINNIQSLYTPYIGQPLPQNQSGNSQGTTLPDISGQTVFDTTVRMPKQFIITFNTDDPPKIVEAKWKTFALI